MGVLMAEKPKAAGPSIDVGRLTGPEWFVIRTKPLAEYVATKELRKDGLEVFFPRVAAARPRLGHGDVPLFPGYLFVKCDPEAQGWPSFRLAHQVLGWLNFEGVIPSLPDRFIDELAVQLDEINCSIGLPKTFMPGDLVRIVSDSINSLAEVVGPNNSSRTRINVLLSFMGRKVPAQVPWEVVQPAGDYPRENENTPRRTRGGGRWIQGFGPRATITA